MRAIESMFEDYADNHRTPGNKACHRIGIPLIVFSLLGMLARAPLGNVRQLALDAGIALIAAAGLYYLVLEWRLAIPMVLASSLFYLGARALPMPFLIALFVLGWVLQFIGHWVFEKKQPAFLHNLLHLLIGPMWILNDLLPVVHLQGRRQSPVE